MKSGEKEMKHFVLHTLIQLSVLYRVEDEVMDGSKPLVTKTQAAKKCTEEGHSLFHYSDIQTISLDSQLEDGESAWIEGYGLYSDFLAWKGCFNETVVAGLPISDMGRPDLYTCLTECLKSEPNTSYIAVKNASCFCITKHNATSLRPYSDGNLFCRIQCSRKAFDYCGGDGFLSIYRLVADGEINLAKNEPPPRQCVTATLKNNRFELSTATCYADRVGGYLCKTTNSSAECDMWDNSTQYCLVQRETTRHEAFSDCLKKNGLLIDLHGEARSRSLMNDSLKYWIGLYRTFKTTETTSGNNTVCLTVTKYNNELFLDPDSCMSKKKYVCRIDSHSSISNSVSVTENPVTQGKPQAPITDSFIVLYSLISILIFTGLLAVFIIICIYKKRCSQKSEERASQRHTENNVHEEAPPFRKYESKVKSDVELMPKTLINNREVGFVHEADLQGMVQGGSSEYDEINIRESKLIYENTHDSYNVYDECGIMVSDCNRRFGWRKSLETEPFYYILEDL